MGEFRIIINCKTPTYIRKGHSYRQLIEKLLQCTQRFNFLKFWHYLAWWGLVLPLFDSYRPCYRIFHCDYIKGQLEVNPNKSLHLPKAICISSNYTKQYPNEGTLICSYLKPFNLPEFCWKTSLKINLLFCVAFEMKNPCNEFSLHLMTL